jgi:type VI secretion system secreted protein VgrG
MPTYSQADRLFGVETSLGPDTLLLESFSGHESLSQPFAFTLELLSLDAAIDARSLLRTAVTIALKTPGGSTRPFHGYVNRFVQLDRSDDLTSYEMEVVPWIWFLSLTADCRVFQNMTVPEIAAEIFGKHPEADFDVGGLGRSYPTREYCVQYRETDLNFVSRLLEEEGIYYYFAHTESSHTLKLADDRSTVPACPGRSTFQFSTTPEETITEGSIAQLHREHVVNPSRVTLRDFDYLQPSNSLQATDGSDTQGEIYDFPGEYVDLDEGERRAGVRLAEQVADQEVVRGASTCFTMTTGHKFELTGYYVSAANQEYLVTGTGHTGRGGGYRSGHASTEYSNTFQCTPVSVPFRPPRLTPKPFVQGSQTAIVVGPSGEEIHTDRHGRVKIQFHWDRLGRKNEQSSCWVRVSQPWAGKGWGAITIPRMGQEVIVDFIEGDPDRPIITGRVYNAEQPVPYELPANKTQSGIKSRSSKNGTGENFNEIRMEDKKGSELLYIHAEKDKQVMVENDRTETVGHDEVITIEHDRTESVGNNESITIAKNRTESVGENESVSISGNRTLTVSKDETISITGKRTDTVTKTEDVNVNDTRTTIVGKDDKLSVSKNLAIDAGDSITLVTGSASIKMQKNGDIEIKGNNIKIEGSGKIQVTASSDVSIKGSKVTGN